ncbi:MAG: S9 family peptidase [Mycobacteriales bacterium]
MQPADLALLRTPGAPTLSPDGRRAVVAVTRLDLEADEYRSRLWLVDTTGAQPPRPLTDGARDTAPAWSPDGRWIAFLRARTDPSEGKPQLYLLPADLGDARPVSTDEQHPLGAGAPRWSPDSARLAYVARVPEQGRYGTGEGGEKRGPEKEPPRRITRLRYRLDDVGFILDRRPHVFVLDPFADQPRPVQVTDGDHDDQDVSWTPDGGLLFASNRDTPDDTVLYTDVYACAQDGSGLRRLTRGRHGAGLPAASPDGGTVFFLGPSDLGPDGRDFVGRNGVLWAVPADGAAPPVPLTDPAHSDLVDLGAGLAVDGAGVLVASRRRGAQELLRVPLSGGDPEILVGGPRTVTGAATAGGTVVAVVGAATSAGELVVVGRDGEPTLTDFGAALVAGASLRPLEEITATAPDGYPVHGWLVRPDPERHPGPRPVLLMIHGGPFMTYGHVLLDEAQVYAGAGYAVVMGNPRGAAGYGEPHGRAIRHAMGGVDADDLLALLDAGLAGPHPDGAGVDPSRVGVLGGSYGGYMTAWLAAHAGDRFRAAIVERAVTSFDSFIGSSDIGYFFAAGYVGTDPEAVRAQSPLTHAGKVDLPVLVIHAEHDWRCPVEQAQRFFVALRSRGVPAELLLFPGEGHELSRSGLPSHRVARFEAVLDWWARHLG